MKVTDFIICDDLRKEMHSKISLMGIYNDRIAIAVKDGVKMEWPFVMSLGLFIRIESEKSFPSDFSFTFKVDFLLNEKSFGGLEGGGKAPKEAAHLLIIPGKVSQFPITEAGELKFVLSVKDGETKKEIFSFTKAINVVEIKQNF